MQKLNDKLSWLASLNNWICVNHLYQSTKSVSKTANCLTDLRQWKPFVQAIWGPELSTVLSFIHWFIKQKSSQMLDYMIDWVALFSQFIVILQKSPVVDGQLTTVWLEFLSVLVGSATELDSIFKFNRAIKVWVEAQI